MAQDDFSVVVDRGANHQTIRVTGDLDMATAPALAELLDQMAADGGSEVRLDLSDVTFLDSAGIGTLVRAMRAGLRPRVIAASRPVDRALELAGIPELLCRGE